MVAVTQLYVLGTESLVGRGERAAVPDIFWPIIGALLCATNHRMSRVQLCQELWPDSESEVARHRLATVLWRMRRNIACLDNVLQFDGEHVALMRGRGLWIDALALSRRAAQAMQQPGRFTRRSARLKLHRTLQLYRGDLLARRDSEGIMVERERIRALYLDATYELARAHQRGGEMQLARECCRTLCSVEPLREDAQRLLIEAYAETGCRALAIQQYRDFAQLLADDLGVEPMPETTALFQRIGRAERIDAEPEPARSDEDSTDHHTILLQTRKRLAEALSLIEIALLH